MGDCASMNPGRFFYFMIKPHDYQVRFTNQIIKKIPEGHKRIVAQLATGGGKTICFSYLIGRYLSRYPSARIGIIVHREELQAQTTKTLLKFGVQNVSVYMVETFNNQLKKHGLKDFDLLVVDECHIGNFKKIIEYYRETGTIIIGFSATPISATKKHPLKADYETIVVGEPIESLIEMGNLCSVVHYSSKNSVDKKLLKKSGGDYTLDSLSVEFSKPKLVEAVVKAYEKYSPGKKTIIFNTTIEHANLVNQAFLNAGYNARSLDSKCDSQTRTDTLKWLKNTPDAILNNVSILTTGFDEPTIEAVIFNRCTKSLPLWLQCCGRGARTAPGKELFLIIDLGDNIKGEGHDYWNAKHDWEQYFYHPDVPGEGPAPMKECPNEDCAAMIYMSTTKCPYCGHLMPRETVYTDILEELSLLPDHPVKRNSSPALEKALYEVAEKVKSAHSELPKRELMRTAIEKLYATTSFQLNKHILTYLLHRYAEYCS